MVIGVPTPNNYSAPWQFVKSLLRVPNKVVTAEGPYIYANRNLLLQKAKYEQDAILMIDADIVFTPQDVERIEELLKTHDIVSGLYVVGQDPYPPCVYKRVEGDYMLTEVKEGLNEVDAIGGGFVGISKDAVQKLPNEAFNDIWEGEVKHGEDISFCHRAKELGYKIHLDSSIKVGHIRTKAIYPK